MKCRRAACNVELTGKNACRHADSGELYCPRCARKINEGAGRVLVLFPNLEKFLKEISEVGHIRKS